MLRPSYSELMEVLNEDRDLDSKITSRYTIVIAAAKRARQIVNGAACDNSLARTDKAVSIAIGELKRGLIKLYPDGLPENYAGAESDGEMPDAYYSEDAFDDYDDLNAFSDDFDDVPEGESSDSDEEDEVEDNADDEVDGKLEEGPEEEQNIEEE